MIDDLSLRYNSVIVSYPQRFTINERSYSIQNGKLVRTHQGRVTSFGRGVLTQNITIINAENHLAVTFTKENRAKVLRLGRAVIGQ